MNDFQFKQATFEDIESIKKLMVQAVEDSPFAYSFSVEELKTKSEFWWSSYLEPYLNPQKGSIFLAFDKDLPIAMGGSQFVLRSKSKHIAYIYWMYTNNDYRGKRLGRTIVEKLIDFILFNPQIIKIALNVTSSQSSAISLYKSFGFEQIGTLHKEFFTDGEYVDLLLFEKMINETTE